MPSFDGYVRVSQRGSRTGPSFISPNVQQDTIRHLAQVNRLDVGEVIEEMDVSGHRDIDERELGRLVRKIEAHESDGLLVWKVSRFSRSLLDGVTVAERIRAAGGRIIGSDLDSAQPMGRAILGFLLGWAEEEWEARRAGWYEARRRAAARGAYPSRTPIGYKRVKSGDDKGHLIPDSDPALRKAIADVFRARARRASLQECADLFAARTRRGASRSGMRQMLSSPVYIGTIQHGDIRFDDKHEPLIDRRTWELAQWSDDASPRDGSLASVGVLAGIVRCAGCGYVCSVSGSGRETGVVSYSCRGRRASGDCPARASIAVAKLDAYVLPQLEARADTVDQEAALVEFHDAQVAFAAADEELHAFLAGARIADLGPDLWASEVTRRREDLRRAADEYRAAIEAQERLTSATGLQSQRGLAQRVIEKVVVRKATRGRHEPVEERATIVWRA